MRAYNDIACILVPIEIFPFVRHAFVSHVTGQYETTVKWRNMKPTTISRTVDSVTRNIHTEKALLDRVKSYKIWIVITLFRLI